MDQCATLLQTVVAEHDTLSLRFSDESTVSLLAQVLRENSPDPETTHSITSERLVSLKDIPVDLTIRDAILQDGDRVEMVFSDGHRACYSAEFLASFREGPAQVFQPSDRIAWDARSGAELPSYDWSGVSKSLAEEFLWLEAVRIHGFAILRRTPTDPDFLETLATRVGPIRETNFGRIFDVRSAAEPTSVAYTDVALAPHTDLSTREYQPGLQYLHCLENNALGGDSTLVDGLTLCRRLQEEHPETYRLLTTENIVFASKSLISDHRWRGPVIQLDANGALDTIRFTMWLRAPIVGPIDELRALYRALRLVTALAEHSSCLLRRRLEPGDLLLMDNRRVLHGRNAFDPRTGSRWLRGCYGERDDLSSRLRMLRRPPGL